MIESDDEVLGKAYDARLMRRLLGYMRPYRARIGLAFASILGLSILQLAPPYLTKVAIDTHIAAGDVDGLTPLALLLLGVLVLSYLLESVQTWALQVTGQRIIFDLRAQIHAHLQRLDVAFFDRNPVGRLMTRVTTDVDALNELFASGVVSVFRDIFMLAGIAVVLFVMDWRLALVALSVLPLIAAVTQWFRRHARQSYREVRGWLARINAFLQENVTGMATVQLFRREGSAVRAVRRRQPRVPRCAPRVGLLLRGVLSRHRGARGPGRRRHHLVRRRVDAAGQPRAGVPGGVRAVLAALLPPHQRPVREVQHPAGGDGVVRAHLRPARHAGGGRRPRCAGCRGARAPAE